mgnify:FL=1|tara:strand:+ start:306 stop:563 length:258 start_codon:yes stop_codon:yes gene_type:complete
MKKYRIKEEKFEDGRSEYYPQFLGKVLEQRRSVLDETKVVFDEVDGYITLNNGGLPNISYGEAMRVMKHDKRSANVIEEKIHVVD